MPVKAFITFFPKKGDIVLAVRYFKTRQNMMSKLKLHIAALRNPHCIVQRLFNHAFVPDTLPHCSKHLIAGLHVKFLRFKLHTVIFFQSVVGLNTD